MGAKYPKLEFIMLKFECGLSVHVLLSEIEGKFDIHKL